MSRRKNQVSSSPPPASPYRTADRLHSAAIHLLRGLRREDRATGLSGPRLSALSVVVFSGPIPVGELAAAEQVRPPTISRLVKELEKLGLVRRRRSADDERVQLVTATPRGRKVLEDGRRRRVAALAEELSKLSPRDQRLLERSAGLLESVAGRGASPVRRSIRRR